MTIEHKPMSCLSDKDKDNELMIHLNESQNEPTKVNDVNHKKLFCLTLLSGGLKAIFQAIILQEIEKQTGKKIFELFDYVSGCSAGALNALLLTHNERFTASDLIDFYKTELKNIFKTDLWTKIKTCNGLLGQQYRNNLYDAAKKVFATTEIADCLTNVMIMSYSITNDRPKMFKSWNLQENGLACDIGMASASIPGVIHPTKIEEEFFVDGAVAAGNSSAVLLSQIFRNEPDIEETNIQMLTIGCGSVKNMIEPKTNLLKWIWQKKYSPLITILLEQTVQNEIVQSIVGDENFTYFNCDLNVDQYNSGTNPSQLEDLIKNAESWKQNNLTEITIISRRLLEHWKYKQSRLYHTDHQFKI